MVIKIVPTSIEEHRMKILSIFLKNQMKKKKLNYAKMATQVDMGYGTVSAIVNGKSNFTVLTLIRFLRVLDLELTIKEITK